MASALPGKATLHDYTAYRTVSNQPVAKLNTGHEIPLVGLGTWKSERGEVGAAVATALRAGYRHIDCAHIYGNEHEIGESFEKVFAEGVVKREEVFVTSKLWNSDHAPEQVEKACRKTLAELKLSYLDLYLIHWPVTGNVGPEVSPALIDTWRAMEGLVEKGLVRSIGVSNFGPKKLEGLMAAGAKIKPAVNQVEAHPYWRNDAVYSYCAQHGIHMTAYSPLGSPDSATVIKRSADVPSVLADLVVGEVAAALGKSAGQVLIRWAVQRGTSVLPKSVKPERIVANLDVVDWAIPDPEFKRLNSLAFQGRMVDGSMWLNPQGPYKTMQQLWDE